MVVEAMEVAEVGKLEGYIRPFVVAAQRRAYVYGVSFRISELGAGREGSRLYDRFKLSTSFCGLTLALHFIFSGELSPPDIVVLPYAHEKIEEVEGPLIACEDVPCLGVEWNSSIQPYVLFDCIVQVARAVTKLSFEEIVTVGDSVGMLQRAKVEAQLLQESFDGVEFLALKRENALVEARASIPLFNSTTKELPPSIARGESSKLTVVWSPHSGAVQTSICLPSRLQLSTASYGKLPSIDGNVSIAEYVPLVNKLFSSCGDRRELILHLHENYLFGLLEWDLLEHSKAVFMVSVSNMVSIVTVRFTDEFPDKGPSLHVKSILPSKQGTVVYDPGAYGYSPSASYETTGKRIHELLTGVLLHPDTNVINNTNTNSVELNQPASQTPGLYTY